MKTHITTDKILAYLDGELTTEEATLVKQHIAECNNCNLEAEQLKTLQNAFAATPLETPSPKVELGFEAMLHEEMAAMAAIQNKPKGKVVRLSTLYKIAVAIAILLTGFYLGTSYNRNKDQGNIAALQNDIQQLRSMTTLTLMESNSASKRIQGINTVNEFSKKDKEIAEALIYRMQYDDNDNVRLTAAQALSHFAGMEVTRKALIATLGEEKNPMIQIAIINILVSIKEKKAVAPMKQLQEKKETLPIIKEQINTLLPQLT